MTYDNKHIVFFDGVCVLCNSTVFWLIRKDKQGKLSFASLQSNLAKDILPAKIMDPSMDSIIFLSEGKIYDHSDAIKQIIKLIDPGPILSLLLYLPSSWTNHIYKLVARNRYRIFGKKDACMIVPVHIRHRFLDI